MRMSLAFLLSFTFAFSDSSPRASQDVFSFVGVGAESKHSEYLAYRHNVEIAVAESALEGAHASILERCRSDESLQCTMLFSDISRSEYPSAVIRLRVAPAAVGPLVALAGQAGTIIRNSTSVEDLAAPIHDSQGNIAKLKSYLQDLERLREKSKDDVGALIELTREIAGATAQLEAALGEEAKLRERVDLQLLNLNFSVDGQASFSSPIRRALGDFAEDLSEGIAQTISGVAYLLPWLVVFIPLFLLLRLLWRKLKS